VTANDRQDRLNGLLTDPPDKAAAALGQEWITLNELARSQVVEVQKCQQELMAAQNRLNRILGGQEVVEKLLLAHATEPCAGSPKFQLVEKPADE